MSSWWVPDRVTATVTREFVLGQLLPDEIEQLDRPVGFGDESLTERTYWESIRDSAPRLFLILVDLGVPDQIFPVIDDGWDDVELPIPLQDIDRLELTAEKNERVDRKFYQRQFQYLLKPIEEGTHQIYTDLDVVPIDVVDRMPGITTTRSTAIDRVTVPNAVGMTFTRRKYPLGNGPGFIPPAEFHELVQSMKSIQNDHIVSYWASYTHKDVGYVLFTPSSDFTLKSFLGTVPACYKSLSKRDRRELVMNWILCLVDTLSFLHNKGRSHCFIKPSTVILNNRNHIFFPESTRLSSDGLPSTTDKSSFDREWYDYAAPEQWFRPTATKSPPTRRATLASLSSGSGDNFSISRGTEYAAAPSSTPRTPYPHLNPQQADIFSLGCIILELLSFLEKRTSSKFASFRSAKHKTAGRGGAVLDTSFHKNLGQVEEWMSRLAKEASKKVPSAEGGFVFQGVAPMLRVVASMLSATPHDRPSALEVQRRVYQILTEDCGIQEPHCVHQYSPSLEYSISRMHLQSHEETTSRFTDRMTSRLNTPRHITDGRYNSFGLNPRHSIATSSSSQTGSDLEYGPKRGPSLSHRTRRSPAWPDDASSNLEGSERGQASLYAEAL